jgi:hypothetical protein
MRTFAEWVKSRKPGPVVPQCDLIVRIVRKSGMAGIDRGSIGSQIDLPRELVDEVLKQLLSYGQLSLTMERGRRVYRAR